MYNGFPCPFLIRPGFSYHVKPRLNLVGDAQKKWWTTMRCVKQWIHSPLFVISITVTVEFGVCAIAFDSTGAFLDSWCRTTPVEVLFVTSANPPCVGTSVCKKTNPHTHTSTTFGTLDEIWVYVNRHWQHCDSALNKSLTKHQIVHIQNSTFEK